MREFQSDTIAVEDKGPEGLARGSRRQDRRKKRKGVSWDVKVCFSRWTPQPVLRQISDSVEYFIRLISPGLDRKPRPLSYEWLWSEGWTRLHTSMLIYSWERTEQAFFKLVSVVFKFTADFHSFSCKCQEVKRNSQMITRNPHTNQKSCRK